MLIVYISESIRKNIKNLILFWNNINFPDSYEEIFMINFYWNVNNVINFNRKLIDMKSESIYKIINDVQ